MPAQPVEKITDAASHLGCDGAEVQKRNEHGNGLTRFPKQADPVDPPDLRRRPCVPRNSGGLEVMILGLTCGNASRHASEACL